MKRILLAPLFLLLSLTAYAQVQTTTVTGTVRDATGAPVPGAKLRITKLVKGGVVVSTQTMPVTAGPDGAVSFQIIRNSQATIEGPAVGYSQPGGCTVNIPDAPTVAFESFVCISPVPPSNLTAHVNAADPHPQYLNNARGDARYASLGSGVTDHGALSGLSDDDHPQYLNNTRGDLRYYVKAQLYTKTEADALLAAKAAASDLAAEIARAQGAEAALQPLDADLTTIAGLSPPNDDIIQRKAGAWTNRSPAQFKSDLALTKNDVSLGNVLNVAQEPAIAVGLSTQYWRGDKSFVTLDTSAVPENGSLYFTNARARSAFTFNSPLSLNATTGVATIQQADSTHDGYLSSVDWGTFNAKQAALGYTPQQQDATLTALAAYNANGLLTQTAADTFAARSIAAGSSKVVVTNGNGVSGNPTVDLGTLSVSDIPTLTSAKISDFNAAASAAAPVQSVNGSTGAVSLTLPANTTATASQFFTAYNATTGAFTKAPVSFGDLSGSATDAQVPDSLTLTSASVTGGLGFTPANKAGDTFTGNVTLGPSGTATSGTQYPSYDLIFSDSGWNTTTSAANTLTHTFRLIPGSGATGSIPNRLALLNNSGVEYLTLDGLNKRGGVNNSSPGAAWHVKAPDASTKGLIVQMAASSSANPFEVQDSTGVAKASIGTTGGGIFASLNVTNAAGGAINDNLGSWAVSTAGLHTWASNTSLGPASAGVLQVGDGGANANGTLKAARFQFSATLTPTGSADSQGNTGDVRYDDSFVYVKVSTGWKRAALSTF